MSQFARLTTTVLLFSFLSSLTFAQTVDEFRKAAERAKARRKQLEQELNPNPKPKDSSPAITDAPKATAEPPGVHPESPPTRTQLAYPQQQLPPSTGWTPAVGDIVHGWCYQAHDGGVNPRLNNGIVFDRELKITSVSRDRTSFSGLLTYTTYLRHGRQAYWGAKVHVQGRISGNKCTLRVTRIIYVPPGTFASKVTDTGVIQNNQFSGTWRSVNGGYGEFLYTLPVPNAGRPSDKPWWSRYLRESN